jgi:hypothetical protein
VLLDGSYGSSKPCIAERVYKYVAHLNSTSRSINQYSTARERAFTKRNILARWSKGGLFPLNPQRLLTDLEKPLAKLEEATGGSVTHHLLDATLPLSAAPVTDVHVSGRALTLLQETTIKQDSHALDDVDKKED